MLTDQREGSDEAGEHDRSFEYAPFTGSSPEIRLLQFTPGADGTSPIALRIQTWSCACAPPFSALSYMWGPPEPESSILVNGHYIKVRENCIFALRQLRSMLQPPAWFWIDAICINQEDIDEKNSQVQRMGDIYSNATGILVSLGDHDHGSRTLFHLLGDLELKMLREHDNRRAGQAKSTGFGERMYLGGRRPGLGDDGSPPWYRWFQHLSFARARELLEMLLQLAQRPYWRRLWILQETMLAKRARLLCGFSVADWNTLSLFYDDISSSVSVGNDFPWTGKTTSKGRGYMINMLQKPGFGPSKTPSALERSAERFQELKRDLSASHMGSLLHNRSLGEWAPKSEHLPHILKVNRDRLCSDPRDRVYGLLHLVRGSPEVQVDYRLSALQVGIAAVKYYAPRKNEVMAKLSPQYFDYKTDFLLGDYVTLLQQQLGISRQSKEFLRVTMKRLGLGDQGSITPAPIVSIILESCFQVKLWRYPISFHNQLERHVIDHNFAAERCSTITRGQDGKLSASLEVYSSDWSDFMQVTTAYDEVEINRAVTEFISFAQKLWPKMSPLPLHGTLLQREDRRQDGVVVGLCSGTTQEGDVLARPVNKNDMLYALILRPSHQVITLHGDEEDIYEIVGQAILVRGCSSNFSEGLKVPKRVTNVPPHVAFSVVWDIEDAILFYSKEADELKRAIVHDQDSALTWSMFNLPAPLPAVSADFVKSCVRLVTRVTSHHLSSFAIANSALGEETNENFDIPAYEIERLDEDFWAEQIDEEESDVEEFDNGECDEEVEGIARALNAMLLEHGSSCHR